MKSKLATLGEAGSSGRPELFSPHLVPFSLKPKRKADGTMIILEDGGIFTRIYTRLVLAFFVGTPAVVFLVIAVVAGLRDLVDALSDVGVFAMVWLAVVAGLLWLARIGRRQTRRLEVRPADHSISLTIDDPEGRSNSFEFPLAECSIRIHRAMLRTRDWPLDEAPHFAAVAVLGPHLIPLACSPRRENVDSYIKSLPPLLRDSVVEDPLVIRAVARMNGNLRG